MENQRLFSGSLVRAVCQKAYGKPLHKATWARWREWVRIPKNRRGYTFDEFCLLFAIAHFRSIDGFQTCELKFTEVSNLAESVWVQNIITGFIEFLDNDLVTGKDAALALSLRGVKTSQATLYRKVPKFSVHRAYRLDYLMTKVKD